MIPKLKFAIANNLFNGVPYSNAKGERKLEATVKVYSTEWPKMVNALKKLHVVEKKQQGPYMVFAGFRDKATNGQYTRRNVNITEFSGAVLDIDEGDLDFDDITRLLNSTNLNYVLYTTHSYDPWTEGKECKFRVVAPYDKAVSAQDQPHTIVGFATMLGLQADFDECSKTLSQPMYLHAAPNERKGEALFSARLNGEFLDAESALGVGQMEVGSKASNYTPRADMGAELKVSDRHAQMKRHMARRRKEGLSLEEVIGELHAWNAKLQTPLEDDQIEGLRRVWDTFDRNQNASGFEEHKIRIDTLPLRQRDVYENVMQHIADSEGMLNAADRQELFVSIKHRRPGATMKAIEEHYRDLTRANNTDANTDLHALRIQFYGAIREEYKDYVWLEGLNSVYHIPSRTYMKKEGFQSKITGLWGRLKSEYMNLMLANKSGQRPISLNLMIEESLIASAADVAYNPLQDTSFIEGKRTLYNQFVPCTLESSPFNKDIEKRIQGYFRYLFPDPKDCKLMLDWLAFVVQKPGVKIRWVPVVYTPLEQMGKDLLMQRLITPLVGATNVGRVSAEYLQEKYTEELTGRQVILLQELDFGRDKRIAQATSNRMKPFITDEIVPLRRFGMPGGQTGHYSSYIAFTNYADAAFVEGGGMRYYLIEGPKERKVIDWYKAYGEWFKKYESECLAYFQQREVEDFPHLSRPMNDHTAEVQRSTVGWPANVLNEALDNGELEGLTALPWSHFAKLVSVLSPEEFYIKAEKLTGRGSGRQQAYVLAALERFGYGVVKTGNPRGLKFVTVGKEEAKTWQRYYNYQKVVSFPGCKVVAGGVKEECEKSVLELEDVIAEIIGT